MGDGNCGSSATALREVELAFIIDAPQGGASARLDTTALADGEHTLAATSTTGQTATRLLVVDNTGSRGRVVHAGRGLDDHLGRVAGRGAGRRQ